MSQQNVLQSNSEEFTIDSGVARADRVALADSLSKVLANSYLLYLKTQSFHWNVVGPLFYSVHKLTESQYENLAKAIDDIAERIRAIGFIAPGSFEQFKSLSSVQEETGSPHAEAMIKQLADDNEACSRLLRKTVEEAEKVEDVKTADLLTERIGQHEENTWMLRAIVS
ncbi:Dps family protein [Marinibactrum halimedae]|uniref:DNA starvation/stationary phase protection protein n=1 Tax=Marinibactrum halimedae TaxID=1444977 RepID=A0AA37WMG8_9GAMM|nr:DNA starvation/stationary phase protection protein [Marinibactrum halimedae]MCD9458181.1 DNA starvation/stationary phase protection protein [Marinibactrum halimedae]GLS25116.1 DNA starvation/stationary phase protection protein [Marinibactrum halimedae]